MSFFNENTEINVKKTKFVLFLTFQRAIFYFYRNPVIASKSFLSISLDFFQPVWFLILKRAYTSRTPCI